MTITQKYEKLLVIMIMISILRLNKINKLMSENFPVKLKQAGLASKNDITNFVKKAYFDNKLKDVTLN